MGHLQEFYGTVDWSVRGIFHSYLGWFSGDAADLFPLPKSELGTRLLALLRNDVAHLLAVIRTHIEKGRESSDRNSCQWALRLSTHSKPVRTIIYTHYHPDHTLGTAAWIDAEPDSADFPTIISHPRTLKEMTRIFSIASTIANIRATRHFGPLLREY